MTTNPDIQNDIYRIVGEEIACKEFHAGPMARAVAEAEGRRDVMQSLYIRYRCEEIKSATERAEISKSQLDQHAELDTLDRKQQNVFSCSCGFRGQASIKKRRNLFILILLLCAYVVPGMIYSFACRGYKAVCPNCGRLLADRVTF